MKIKNVKRVQYPINKIFANFVCVWQDMTNSILCILKELSIIESEKNSNCFILILFSSGRPFFFFYLLVARVRFNLIWFSPIFVGDYGFLAHCGSFEHEWFSGEFHISIIIYDIRNASWYLRFIIFNCWFADCCRQANKKPEPMVYGNRSTVKILYYVCHQRMKMIIITSSE